MFYWHSVLRARRYLADVVGHQFVAALI